ncbi:hypothetical protein CK203_029790 [Vitis vinifera]|uniref:Uncharacterized protein n=1 Tax=Vitis vinifera TaxID=29760 RepID=A0A438ID96_VITVI|nr:hypothetical protein CK203_029790 [Vitis vinifera]
MACTFNQLLDSVSLASQMLIGSDVLMIQGLLMASMFFLVLTLSHGVRVSKRLLEGPTLSLDTKHWLTQQQRVACITSKLAAHARTKQMEVDVHFFNILKVELTMKESPFCLRWHV